MSDKMAFLLFGDQSLDTYAFLADFCGGSNIPSVLARSCMEQVGTSLRREVDQLSSIERQRVPRFASVKELNENYHSHEGKNAAVDSALLCITQLAHYIEYVLSTFPIKTTRTTDSRPKPCGEDARRFYESIRDMSNWPMHWPFCSNCDSFIAVVIRTCPNCCANGTDGVSNWCVCCCPCRAAT